MKTFHLPETSPSIGEFVYEGCRYSGINNGLTFSVLSDGLAEYLITTFPFLEETSTAPVAANEYCCSKCGKDCGSKYMKERHEKVCKEPNKGLATVLKPNYIFWNYKNLDRTQLTPEQLIPENLGNPIPQSIEFNEDTLSEPAPGVKNVTLIGKTMQQVTTDRDGVDWYGDGLTDDIVN